ncbi:MAG: hypothetical protein JWM39_579 [Parcubacteria group bacterium]|nr:hypothetical protein [Parcubacteria group bacterium]
MRHVSLLGAASALALAGALLALSTPANATTVIVSVGVPPGFIATNSVDFTGFTGTAPGVSTYTNDGMIFDVKSLSSTQDIISTLAGSNPSFAPSQHLGYIDIHSAPGTAFKALSLDFGSFFSAPGDNLLLRVMNGTTFVTAQTFGGVPFHSFETLNIEATSGTFTDLWLAVKPTSETDPLGTTGLEHNAIAIDNVFAQITEVHAVPEPSMWALMLVGFGGVGAMFRKLRRPVVVPT